jgi:hypothetical protein
MKDTDTEKKNKVRTQEEDYQQAKEKDLARNLPSCHLDLGLIPLRPVRQ